MLRLKHKIGEPDKAFKVRFSCSRAAKEGAVAASSGAVLVLSLERKIPEEWSYRYLLETRA